MEDGVIDLVSDSDDENNKNDHHHGPSHSPRSNDDTDGGSESSDDGSESSDDFDPLDSRIPQKGKLIQAKVEHKSQNVGECMFTQVHS